jgi:hypothetical protein
MEHESSNTRFWVTIKSLEIVLTLRQFGHSILMGTFFIGLLLISYTKYYDAIKK